MFDKLFDFGDDASDDDNPFGLTDFTRQRPNGRMTSADAEETEFGADRQPSGRFASKDRDPVPLIRDRDTGRLESDAFAAGNFGEFDRESKWRTTKDDD